MGCYDLGVMIEWEVLSENYKGNVGGIDLITYRVRSVVLNWGY